MAKKKRLGMDFLKSLPAGMVKGIDMPASPVKTKQVKQQYNDANKSKLYMVVWVLCKEHGLKYETEYKFHHKRKFRFDMAITEKKIAIEYEGIHSEKSRHTTIAGYNRDSEKYNLAATEGWRVLRYTSSTINNAGADLLKLINDKK